MDSSSSPVAEMPKPKSGFAIRSASTLVLLGVFFGIMWGGHIPCALSMFLIQGLIVKELFTLARTADEARTMPLFRTQQWFFFLAATFYLYGRFVRKNLALTPIASDAKLISFGAWILSRHLLISYSLYTASLVLFVLTLQPNQYSYQFKQLAWTHLIVFFTVFPTSCYVPLMFEGLVWFFLPSALIIVNDIMAYLAGKAFGRTPLIQLSPKKTWEGFVGGALGTMVASFLLTWVFAQFPWMYCPRRDLSFGWLHCEPPLAFVPTKYHPTDLWQVLPDFLVEEIRPLLGLLPQVVRDTTANIAWTCMPAQMHAVMLAMFASIVGPFGGFFASGFKRALGIKDFGDSIPGHGGLTDRFDCQMPMAVFCYLYFHMYIASDQAQEEVLDDIMDLTCAHRLVIFRRLAEMLVAQGMLSRDVTTCIDQSLDGSADADVCVVSQ